MGEDARNTVDDWTKWVKEDEDDHQLARALREGAPAMKRHALQNEFMLPNPGEMRLVEIGGSKTTTLYELRVRRSDLPNPWADSIRATASLPFSAAISLDGWDEELAGKTNNDANGKVIERVPGWVDTITPEGQTLDEYAAETFEDALFEGICFSFVDNDPRKFPDPQSRRLAGAQPRVTKLLRNDLRRIHLELRNGVPRLVQIAFKHAIPVVDVADPNAWSDFAVDARKVVTAGNPDLPKGHPGRQVTTRVYVPKPGGGWQEDVNAAGRIIPDNPQDELVDIPLVPHYTKRTGAYRGRSPYLDTAWMEASLWNHNSELSGLAREAALVHVHESGVMIDQKTQKPLLGDTANARYHWSTDPQAGMTLLEMQGTALKGIRELIEWKVRLIEKAHHQLQTEKPTGPVTAREITLEGVRASSALEMWVIFQERAWKRILDLCVLLGGLQKRGMVSIPHDFGLPSAGMDRNHQLFLGDKMSPRNYWGESKRAGDVDEKTFDMEAEINWAEGREKEKADAAERIANAGAVEPPAIPPGRAAVEVQEPET